MTPALEPGPFRASRCPLPEARVPGERGDRYDALVQAMSGGAYRLVEWLAHVGVSPADSGEVRDRKVTLTLAALTVSLLAVIWVATYLALGLPVSAAIPFAYQVASIGSLAIFARSKDFSFFRSSQLVFMLLLPFLLQLSLGGFVASSAVSAWALVSALGALFFLGPREAVPWFVAFLALIVVAGLLEPIVSQQPAGIPVPVQTTFFILNISGPALTAYLLLQYSVRARDAALASSERLLLNLLPAPIAERLKHHEGRFAQAHEEVTVLFADVVDFTPFTERTAPERVVSVLDVDLAIRVGMASGPVIAGVIGRRKFIYDLWGDTVNTASRMESHGLPGRIQVTATTYERLRDRYRFEERGEIEVKGKGRLQAYLLVGRLASTGG